MDNSASSEQFPPCNIDIKRADITHITAWRDRSEFQAVYDKLFNTPADDIASKENAEMWLNVWKVRLSREIPICIRCTLAVLEAILFDLRSQRDGRENTTETKNIYAGAFTRFINFMTEGQQNFRWKKKSIAQHVRDIGIEPYLVELRHLCAHRSISVSIDVFRRSAKYCMDWLKGSYWERELAIMQPVTVGTIRSETLQGLLSELTSTLQTYDAATAGRAMGFFTVSQLEGKLKPEQLAHLKGFGTDKLLTIAEQMLQRLKKNITLPRNSIGVNAMCDGLLTHCQRMLLDPVRTEENNSRKRAAPFGAIHSGLFQYLASFNYLRPFFERLMAICENESEPEVQRRAASYWAFQIASGFQLLRQYKVACKALPSEQMVRFHETSKPAIKRSRRMFYEWLQQSLPTSGRNQLVLGRTVDCPWHLTLSSAYLRDRLMAANRYTRDILPILLALAQPALKQSQLENIEQLMDVYCSVDADLDDVVCNDDGSSDQTPSKSAAKPKAPRVVDVDAPEQIYTKEDVLSALSAAKRRASGAPEGEEELLNKKPKRYGPWSVPPEANGWERCSLGTYPPNACGGAIVS